MLLPAVIISILVILTIVVTIFLVKRSPNALKYSVKVWLTSVLISPIAIIIVWKAKDEYIFVSMIMGLILSFPGWLVFYLTTISVNKSTWTIFQKKSMLILIGILLITVTIYIPSPILVNSSSETINSILGYTSITILGIIVYKLENPEENHDKSIEPIN